MFGRVSYIICLFLIFLPVDLASGQETGPRHSDPYWQVSYWNNTALSGEPVGKDQHARIDFDWGEGRPHNAVGADRFSVRWVRYIDFTAGTFRFTAASDDGIRVYVDGNVVINGWHDHPVRTFTGDISLTAGHHLVVVEYYENMGAAVAMVSWEPIPATPDKWRGEYYANRWLSGSPSMVRDDASIDFQWGYDSPASGIPSDGFSTRWTRTAYFEAGVYRFTATSDDGLRIYVDDRLLLDRWYDHPAQRFTAEVRLTAGDHRLVVEYYENTGLAVVQVSWQVVPPEAWSAEYFDNRWLRRPANLMRDDADISFNWGYSSPAPGIPSDGFSVRWMRTIAFREGLYRFTVTTDDGVRLWVGEHLLIDQWRDQPLTSHSGTIHLVGGVPIVMEYYENGGIAAARLTWEQVEDDPPQPIPGVVIVDDRDPGFVKGGSATAWRTAAEGHGGRLTWTRNNDRARPNYNWARWYPDLAERRYEVFVYIPERYTTTARARYWVSHRDGYVLRQVSQSANGNRWVSLGTFWFRGTREDFVSLADVTFEPHLSRLIAFDAVKWVLH